MSILLINSLQNQHNQQNQKRHIRMAAWKYVLLLYGAVNK